MEVLWDLPRWARIYGVCVERVTQTPYIFNGLYEKWMNLSAPKKRWLRAIRIVQRIALSRREEPIPGATPRPLPVLNTRRKTIAGWGKTPKERKQLCEQPRAMADPGQPSLSAPSLYSLEGNRCLTVLFQLFKFGPLSRIGKRSLDLGGAEGASRGAKHHCVKT